MKEGGFQFYFFIHFLYVNACGMNMCVCVCGVGMEPREGWWVSCYTILDNIALGLGF